MKPGDGVGVLVDMAANTAFLGALADHHSEQLRIPKFAAFTQVRIQVLTPPYKPILALYSGGNPKKAHVFELVNNQKKIDYQIALAAYERNKQATDLLNSYAGTLAGYGTYLIRHHPQVLAFFGKRRPFLIEEESRRLHSYVTGGTGSGKSECLKSLIWQYIAHDPTCAVILIDPHGDVALQAAQFYPNRDSGRLVYIDPSHDKKHFPCINPFDCVPDKAALSDHDAEKLADEFLYAFAEILRGDLSDQMRTVLLNTLPVLMKYPNSSVYDLLDFLELPEDTAKRRPGDEYDPPQAEYKAEKYKAFARKHYSNRMRVDFLHGQFEKDTSFRATRNSLQTRLHFIFSGLMMQTLFRGKRTVNIEELIAARKCVIFNLNADIGIEAANTIGRFLLINLKIFALNQAKVPEHLRVPCHAFVDECQRFITPSIKDILSEARKFYLFLTLAQQVVCGEMNRELFSAVRSNVGLKLTGANSIESLKIIADDTGADIEELLSLGIGRFSLWRRRLDAPEPPITVNMPKNTLKNRGAMKADEWERVLADQIRRYYVAATPEISPIERPSEFQTPKPQPNNQTPGHGPIDPLLMDISNLTN